MNVTQTQRPREKSEAVHRAASGLIAPNLTAPHGFRPAGAGNPPVIAKARGSTVIDVDGNEYVNYASGPEGAILGHADERVAVAINKTVSKGLDVKSVSEAEVRLAELVAGRFPQIDMVRFVDSSTEAFLAAVRMAQVHTNRRRIVVFAGYRQEPVAALLATNGEGSAAENLVPYNDLEALEDFFRRHGPTIAAVIVEPVATGFGVVLAADGFLARLRELCDAHGAVLVFDESVTAFCTAPGGTSGAAKVVADLTLLGSTLGGGVPLAAWGGSRAIMKGGGSTVAPARPGLAPVNLLAMAAGIATLQALAEPGLYDALEENAAHLDEGLRAAAAAAGVPHDHTRFGNLLSVFFTGAEVHDLTAAQAGDNDLFERYYCAMLERGVLLPSSPFTPISVSTAHTDKQITQTIEHAHESLRLAGTGSA